MSLYIRAHNPTLNNVVTHGFTVGRASTVLFDVDACQINNNGVVTGFQLAGSTTVEAPHADLQYQLLYEGRDYVPHLPSA